MSVPRFYEAKASLGRSVGRGSRGFELRSTRLHPYDAKLFSRDRLRERSFGLPGTIRADRSSRSAKIRVHALTSTVILRECGAAAMTEGPRNPVRSRSAPE